jgi:hypothetical protein
MRQLATLILALLPLQVSSSSKIATGIDLLSEMSQLQESLTRLQTLLNDKSVEEDEELMNKAAKLFRRARWLIYSSNHEISHTKGTQNSHHLRGSIGSNETVTGEGRIMESEPPRIIGKDDPSRITEDGRSDRVARNMYDATIAFPECRELFLEDCLQLISNELASLEMSCEVVIREKRSPDQPGYNKVVIVTDLTASNVVGRDNDGIVSYPFTWDDAKTGPVSLGVEGKWDCMSLSPEDCCAKIQKSAPNPDTKGNYIQCHIFVPFGGIGNKKRSDRVFVNLSQDGRVQESPFVS